ncbi:antitoxin VapB family protein [Candidatus Woesearchaeota archaeon]|nr:antitoxin VapB family protein [Candidatus Woesearchaeota archaeon]
MATKTLTITEQAYGLLSENKLEEESFSEVIVRVITPKKRRTLLDYFGILTLEEGELLFEDLEKIRAMNLKTLQKRFS